MELKLVKELVLNWKHSFMDVDDEVEEEEELLLMFESLMPHPNLERLIIKWYPGSKYPSWMDRVNIGVSLPNIVYIQLYGCRSLRHVAALGLLPCLQQLHLDRMYSVEYLIDRSSVEEEADQLLFPSLKELDLVFMRELKSVVEPTEASQTEAANNSRYFPVLEKLEICECPLFTSMSNEEDGKQFVSLLELCFIDMILRFCKEIVSLREWMGNLTSLHELHLQCLDSLALLPDCMQRLTSLQRLVIMSCPKLESIPDCVRCLTSLQRLVIKGCPKLESRCEKETGVDWNKIAHIPNIWV